MKILFIGDIIGKPGRRAVKEALSKLRAEKKWDFCIANGENAASGLGITPPVVEELLGYGVNAITSGNHIFKKKEIMEYLNNTEYLLRPANYPPLAPGRGEGVFRTSSGESIAILHLLGRVFMDQVDCPFQTAEKVIDTLIKKAKVIVVDFHAEATSEKQAMGWFLDGRVSAVIGTHTHVQTADERILTKGTAYISDAGMTGPIDSVIGVDKDIVINKFLTRVPQKFIVANGRLELQGVLLDVDSQSGMSRSIERIKVPLEEPCMDDTENRCN